MSSSIDVVALTLAAAVADAGTFTVAYPTGKTPGHYTGGVDHILESIKYGPLKATAGQISLSFDATVITVTNNAGVALEVGTEMWLQLDIMGRDDGNSDVADPETMVPIGLTVLNLGAPDVADANGFVVSQNLTAAGVFSSSVTVAVALAAGALAGVCDVPRNIVAAWTGTAVITITGTDYYGNTIVESSASGTSLAGKKAFKTVTNVEVSADVTGLTVGTGDVLGLPAFLPGAGLVVAELEDGAAATAGTVVAGATAVATATTGDVRGTYDPNSAANGAKSMQLVAALPDPSYKGVAQYAG